MKKHLLFIFLLVIIFTFLSAEILRVNNNSEAMAPYTSIQSAHNVANNGDTLLIEGSNIEYSNFTTSKQITILGPGIFLSNYSSSHYSEESAYMNYIIIGNNVTLSGVALGRILLNGGVQQFEGSNIILKNSYNKATLAIRGINTKIFHSWLNGPLIISDSYTAPDSLILYNCRIASFDNETNAFSIFFNNVIGNISDSNFTHFYNNIIENLSVTGLEASYGYVYKYNIFGCPCPPGSGLDAPELHNVFDVDLSSVFTYGEGDRYYELIPGSVAEGAGLDGVDCGMFGGPVPYPLGGIPPELPAISNLEVNRSGATPDDLNIIFEAKTHPRPHLQP